MKYVYSRVFAHPKICLQHSTTIAWTSGDLLCFVPSCPSSPALGDIETREDGLHHAVLTHVRPWRGRRKPKPKPGAFMVIYA